MPHKHPWVYQDAGELVKWQWGQDVRHGFSPVGEASAEMRSIDRVTLNTSDPKQDSVVDGFINFPI